MTSPPARAKAKDWFKPLPPASSLTDSEDRVSPGRTKSCTLKTLSMFIEPKLKTDIIL